MRNDKFYKITSIALLIILTITVWFAYSLLQQKPNIFTEPYGFAQLPPPYDNIRAAGTWNSSAELASSINTSEIFCDREAMECVEARAEIFSGNYLSVDLSTFEIESWTEREILSKPQISTFGCTQYSMRIDLVHETINATRSTIKTTDECEGVNEGTIHFQLISGLDVAK